MERLKGKAQSHPQHYLCLLPAAPEPKWLFKWDSNSKKTSFNLNVTFADTSAGHGVTALPRIWWPLEMTFCWVFFLPPLSLSPLFCVLIFVTRRVPRRKLSDASRPLPRLFACVKNTVSSHGRTCEFKGNVNNSAIDGAARLFRMDYARATSGGKKKAAVPPCRL